MEVRIERLEAVRVVARRHEGPYEGLAEVVDSMVRWLRTTKEPGGAVTTVFAGPAGLEAGAHAAAGGAGPHAHDEPGDGHGDGPDVQAQVWLPWTKEAGAVDDAIGWVKDVPGVTAASVIHTGNPLGVPRLALALRAFLEGNGYRLDEETRIVHLMPDWEDPDAWVTQVQVPIAAAPPRSGADE